MGEVEEGWCFFFQAGGGIRDAQESRGLGDVYERQARCNPVSSAEMRTRGPAVVAMRVSEERQLNS